MARIASKAQDFATLVRFYAVALLGAGKSSPTVADMLCVAVSTVVRAAHAYLAEGVLMANASALLGGNYRRKHFFVWEYTTDGKTFIGIPSTPEATTTLAGLTPLTTVGFRVAVTTAKGITSAWSQVVNALIH